MKKISLILLSFIANPALAANEVVIEQVGAAAHQTGSGNKSVVNIKQLPADAKEKSPEPFDETEIKPKDKSQPDFQAKVLSDPSHSERARAQELINQNNTVTKDRKPQ